MSSARPYGVYTAAFPFLGSGSDKVRPVIVLSKPQGRYNVIAVAPISSKSKCETVDVKLSDWQSAGLIKPSIARVHRVTTLLQLDLISQLGVLTNSDKKAMRLALKELLELE